MIFANMKIDEPYLISRLKFQKEQCFSFILIIITTKFRRNYKINYCTRTTTICYNRFCTIEMYLITIFFSYEQKIKYIFIHTSYKIILSPTTDNEMYKMRYIRVHQFLCGYVYLRICMRIYVYVYIIYIQYLMKKNTYIYTRMYLLCVIRTFNVSS